MPVDINLEKSDIIYQREQYAKGGVGVKYWDYRDETAFSYLTGNDILDIGCGEGISLEKLVKKFPEMNIQGVDAEQENVEICKKHGLPIQFGSVYELPFENSSVDTVFFLEVLEHLAEPERALAEIFRVLRPRGRMILIFPNDLTFKVARIMMGMIKEAYYDCGHVKQWHPGEFSETARGIGFQSLSARNLPFFFWRLSLHHIYVGEKKSMRTIA